MTLTQIALQMHREAQATRRSRRDLPGGLTVTLWQDGSGWILSLTRKGVAASETEVNICREKFNIPADAETEGPEEIKGHYVTRLRWSDAPLQQLSFAGGEARPNQYRFD